MVVYLLLVLPAMPVLMDNVTFVGHGRCTVAASSGGMQYITGAYNNFLLRTACKAKCLEHDACIGYWYYSHSLFSSCFLDGASLNGTKAMAAALGPGWQADTDDPFGDAFCGNACDVNATDHNKHGGTAECYRVRTRTSSADNGEALA